MTDWSKCAAVESVPGRLSGAWVFTRTRVPVSALFGNLAAGATVKDFLEWFPGVESGRSKQCWNTRSRAWTRRSALNVLFDHGTPAPLRGYIPEHAVETAAEKGWSGYLSFTRGAVKTSSAH